MSEDDISLSGLRLNTPAEIVEYVSSNDGGSMVGSLIGSSVSKSDKNSNEAIMAMAQNAMLVIQQLQEKV